MHLSTKDAPMYVCTVVLPLMPKVLCQEIVSMFEKLKTFLPQQQGAYFGELVHYRKVSFILNFYLWHDIILALLTVILCRGKFFYNKTQKSYNLLQYENYVTGLNWKPNFS